jgi:hypothetical protein
MGRSFAEIQPASVPERREHMHARVVGGAFQQHWHKYLN